MPSYTKEDVSNAIAAFKAGEYVSISCCARVFDIPYSTLRNRLDKRKSYSESYVK